MMSATLPANIVALLPTLSMDQVATAATIVRRRPRTSGRSRTFWMNRLQAITDEARRRGFVLYTRPELDYYLWCHASEWKP